MADISTYVRQIQVAARGEEVRDALVDSLNAMNSSIAPTVEAALTEAKNRGDFTGPRGEAGPQGPKGDQGDVGPAGDQGPKGDTGDAGPKGDRGDVGPAGAKGSKGDKGEKGDVGPNEISGSTATGLNGILRGNGSNVEVQTLDTSPTPGSSNPITSGGVAAALEGFQDSTPAAPAFLDASNVPNSGLFMNGWVLSAFNGRYYRTYLTQLFSAALCDFRLDEFNTRNRTVVDAINELYGRQPDLSPLLERIAAVEQQNESQSRQIAFLRRQVTALREIVDPDGILIEVDGDGTLNAAGMGVSVEASVLTIDSSAVSVEDEIFTI